MAKQSASTVPQLGELLRYWRQKRGKSQLDLSLDTGISQRHLSFVSERLPLKLLAPMIDDNEYAFQDAMAAVSDRVGG